MWKKIHWIIIKEVISFFLVALFIFLSLLLIGRFLRLGNTLISLSLTLFDVLKLIFYLSPFILFLLFPIACMLAVFLTFQRMESDKELLILKTGGISFYQLLPAPLLFFVICVGIHLVVSFYLMPFGLKRFQNTMLDMVKNKTKLSIKAGFFNTDIPGMTLYVQRIRRGEDVLENVVVERKIKNRRSCAFITAPLGIIKSDYERGKIVFSLFRGSIYEFNFDGWNVIKFGTYLITLDLNNMLKKVDLQKDKSEVFSWGEINAILGSPGKYPSKLYRKLKVEKQKRISLPFACIVLGFFAISLAWLFHGLKRHLGVILMIFMFFVYYSIFSFSLNLGKLGYLNPILAAWIPNFLFGLVAFVLTYLSQRVR